MRAKCVRGLVVLAALGLLAGCGDDDSDEASPTTSATETASETATTVHGHSDTTAVPAAANACPVDGCRVRLESVEREGDELHVSFTANFAPDVSRNHFHVYWDTWTAAQVSDNAQTQHGVAQGEWVPTADNPFTTASEVSVAARRGSTTLCVTAGDRDHNVIDPNLADCRDVSGLLS